MRSPSDLARAWLMFAAAPLTVRYGDDLRFAGSELPRPRTYRVPTRHGPVPAHVYRPASAPTTRPLGAYVHLHGGAFLMRHARMDDWWCRFVAATAGVVVVNVDFHAGPRVTYPVAHEEAHDVAAWVAAAGADTLGTQPQRVAVGGFSSGGALAAAVALQARDLGSFAPALQVLGVPALDMASPPDPAHPGMLRADLRRLVRRVHFPDADRRHEPYASPLLADDLTGLAPAVVLTAERDVLRAEGDAYAARLREAGVPVLHDVTPGADHYFLNDDLRRAPETMHLVADEIAHRTAV